LIGINIINEIRVQFENPQIFFVFKIHKEELNNSLEETLIETVYFRELNMFARFTVLFQHTVFFSPF